MSNGHDDESGAGYVARDIPSIENALQIATKAREEALTELCNNIDALRGVFVFPDDLEDFWRLVGKAVKQRKKTEA